MFIWCYYRSIDSFETEWTYSEHPGKEFGKFVHSSGAFYNDAEADKGIQTSQDARFYALSKKFAPFSNEGKDLVIQYTVKHEQNIDCGGGYVKLFNCDLEPKKMHGETPYEIMFGKYIFVVLLGTYVLIAQFKTVICPYVCQSWILTTTKKVYA